MIVLIPLGGTGQRFKNNGYKKPKALINIFGKPILFHLLDSLNTCEIDYIYIPYNKEYEQYNFEGLVIKNYPKINFKFFCLKNNTNGAAETINIAIDNLKEEHDKPILCLDSDNFYLCDIIKKWNGDNCVFSFRDINKNPIYSYIKCVDEYICDIKEKEKISDYACTGAYGFKSIKKLKLYTSKIIDNNITQKSEFYTSCVIEEMIKDKLKIKNKIINESDFICLGTPSQLRLFHNNYPRINCCNNTKLIEPKRICFDLDNTLVTYPETPNDYTTVKPIVKNINYLKYLKNFGNVIIIYTARRMKTHCGNIGKINSDIGKITFDTLDKFNIPYDEIYFGKPHADFYIDDLAVNCFDNMEKELGFYNNKIEPRHFHSIENTSFSTVIKKGNELSGEIYYYNNLPNQIKDMFPLFFGQKDNSFIIEKINGITLNELYLSELLTETIFENVLNSVSRIHDVVIGDDKSDIYCNYAKKMSKRFNEYDYSAFRDSQNVYKELMDKLNNYEKNNVGIKKTIHGDPVFTNIIINNYNKIKFIDMRGKQGDMFSLCGDCLYDWAKIYQSLIGYDEILLSKQISPEYKKKMISYFNEFFIKKYSENDLVNLKIITKSLLFTLIPLHDNEKCSDFYELIFSCYLQ